MTLGPDVPSTHPNGEIPKILPTPAAGAEPLITTEDRRWISLKTLEGMTHPIGVSEFRTAASLARVDGCATPRCLPLKSSDELIGKNCR